MGARIDGVGTNRLTVRGVGRLHGCTARIGCDYIEAGSYVAAADGTWPAFPSDLMSVLIVVATQTRGTCLFFEKMFESRLYFVDRLRQMGAKIVQCDPHRAVVTGPSNLAGGLVAANDIRAGIALVIAALCADGDSVIEEAQTIDRGYPDVAKVLNSLGARVRRIK